MNFKKIFTLPGNDSSLFLIIIVILLMFIYSLQINASSPPKINATTAILMDIESGQILYHKNMHQKRPPASLTKILTTIIALEKGNLSEMVTVSKRAAYQEGSSIYLLPGEKLTLKELLYGVMLASGNDAAVAVAEHISGSVEEFARLMNEKAEKIGAKNSNFLNPNGLPQSGHYSTAYDMAMIMSYALHTETFSEITATKHKTISGSEKAWGRGLRNHNKLLWDYQYTTGGKTGYTKKAGRCLISSARKNGTELVSVLLNSANDWLETVNLFDYGFENFEKVKIVEKGEKIHTLKIEEAEEKEVNLISSESISILIPGEGKLNIKKMIKFNSNYNLPLDKGATIGKLYIYQKENDQLIGYTDLESDRELTFDSFFKQLWHQLRNIFN